MAVSSELVSGRGSAPPFAVFPARRVPSSPGTVLTRVNDLIGGRTIADLEEALRSDLGRCNIAQAWQCLSQGRILSEAKRYCDRH